MSRLSVNKTYKLYIGGKFPRTESGRYYELKGKKDVLLANVSHGSRKDFRNAVVAARKGFAGWSTATAYLRGQILYRIAEMLEGRAEQFEEELRAQGGTPAAARKAKKVIMRPPTRRPTPLKVSETATARNPPKIA